MTDYIDTEFNATLTEDIVEREEHLVSVNEITPSKQPLSHLERTIAELKADKISNDEIANRLEIAKSIVLSTTRKPAVKQFIQDLINAQLELTKEYRLSILSKIIEDRIKEIEEDLGGNYSKATKKDLVDLIQVEDLMLKEREKKELGTNEDTYITLLQQIIKKD